MIIVDTHTHIFPTEAAGQKAMRDISPSGYWGKPEDLLTLMDRADISRAVIVGTLPLKFMLEAAEKKLPGELTGEAREQALAELQSKMTGRLERLNRFLCEQADRNPCWIPFAAVNPFVPTGRLMELMEKACHEGIRGLKFHPMTCHYYPLDQRLLPVYQWAETKKLPLLFHGGLSPESREVQYSHPDGFAELARKYPRLTIIVAHLGQNFYDAAVDLARTCPNVYLDTSYAVTSVPGTSY